VGEQFCATCPDPSEDDNHLAGRGHDHAQLDDELTAPACHECHEVFHEELRILDLDTPLRSDNVFERLERRLRRVAVFFGQLFARYGWLWLKRLADAFVRWADEVRGEIDRLDLEHPGWRFA
jgi:hypothetical protein